MPFSQRLGIACLPNKVGLGLGDGQSCCHSILILRRTLQSATDTGPHPTEGFEEGYEVARIERRGVWWHSTGRRRSGWSFSLNDELRGKPESWYRWKSATGGGIDSVAPGKEYPVDVVPVLIRWAPRCANFWWEKVARSRAMSDDLTISVLL